MSMKADQITFVTGCVLVLGFCAESAWIGFRDGLQGLTPPASWTASSTVELGVAGLSPESSEGTEGVVALLANVE